ncbi:PHP domain-containing protein [Clostridium sardiniense]|uniref:PHP domain-containing protein n=1 Tax=Clostridium sardiniense TaxID=29369 RepID=A0ABS7L1Q3_CLOSR|nr:PHP domain-containing protein [Clostridium sardiniense]MBY0756985.1 PHP domain-containing protein [Clostridium sardiniense]MDQ0460383.1 putative metal-dependent phosphoesterase TrpH [Clostridium sardiniense]
MTKVDFHVHTSASDGVISPQKVVDRAYRNGVSILAITDHDTVNGLPEAINEAKIKDIKIIPAVEFSCNHNNESIHLLGFFKDDSYKSKEFLEILDSIKRRRILRAEEMVKKLYDIFEIKIDFKDVLKYGESVIARPHIAKAIMDAGYPYTQDYIFDNFIGKDRPAYVPTNKITIKEGIDILHKFNAIVVLAHPILIKNSPLEEFLKFDLDGIEAVYFLNSKEDEEFLLSFAREHNLLVTAGSDCHGDFINDKRHGDIGDMSLDDDLLGKLMKRLSI